MFLEMSTAVLALALTSITESATTTYILNIENAYNWPVARLMAVKWQDKHLQCHIAYDTLDLPEILDDFPANASFERVSESEFNEISKLCGLYGGVITGFGITWPGTNWCGPGNMAKYYDDLGKERETDMCCRDHDYCENISGRDTKFNLTNSSYFTRLHCDCDKTFYSCLKKANSKVAHSMGYFYFNLVQNMCYDYTHPIVRCIDQPSKGNCNKYELDETEPKIWQFFEARRYSSK